MDAPQKPSPRSRARSPRRRGPRLATLGDLTLDIVIRSETAVASGSDVPGTIGFRAGGSAANTARAFAGLGGEAAFMGAVGDDRLGRALVRALRGDGVRVHAPRVAPPTARLAVLVDVRGERSFVTQRGAADALRPSHLRRTWIERAHALHLPAYSLIGGSLRGAALAAVEHARRAEVLVSVDLSSRRPLLAAGRGAARQMIGEVEADILFANVTEARSLAGANDARLLELAPVVVIKEGASGCRVLWLAADRGRGDVLQLAVATKPLKVADTTGAGDAFDAGFLFSLLEQLLGQGPQALRRAQVLRRAAVAGHRAAAALLGRPRPALPL